MENENKNFELSLLKNQLDPHFIFNTLTGIRYLVLQNPVKARLCLESLSDLIRENLKQTNWEKVSVERENSLVRTYVDLMKIQLEEKLDFRQEIDVAAKQCIIPTMLIQMLVENAIKHGVARVTTTGFVDLSVMIKSGNVTITVENSINPDASGKSEGFGLGLKNIKKRLKLIYGVQSSFLFDILDSAAKITIILPKEKT